jgi:hypothetical protein
MAAASNHCAADYTTAHRRIHCLHVLLLTIKLLLLLTAAAAAAAAVKTYLIQQVMWEASALKCLAGIRHLVVRPLSMSDQVICTQVLCNWQHADL